MSLPVILMEGQVSIYQAGSMWGIVTLDVDGKESPLRFGKIDALNWGTATLAIGDNVMYNINDADQLYYRNTPYFIVDGGKIKMIENVYDIYNLPPP